jgi:5-formyltetrahydrofolate cyclo-ligase
MTAFPSKAALREAVLARRDALDPVDRVEMSLAVAEHAAGKIEVAPGEVVAGFLPIRTEIDLRPLMDILRARGARLCVPAVVDRQTIEFRELVRGAELVRTGFGTSGPGPDAAVLDPHLLLMPLSVFDGHGNRIGYGAGHYDRAIARLRARGHSPRLVGCAFSLQEVDLVPAEPHDIRMQAVVTEKGYRIFPSD